MYCTYMQYARVCSASIPYSKFPFHSVSFFHVPAGAWHTRCPKQKKKKNSTQPSTICAYAMYGEMLFIPVWVPWWCRHKATYAPCGMCISVTTIDVSMNKNAEHGAHSAVYFRFISILHLPVATTIFDIRVYCLLLWNTRLEPHESTTRIWLICGRGVIVKGPITTGRKNNKKNAILVVTDRSSVYTSLATYEGVCMVRCIAMLRSVRPTTFQSHTQPCILICSRVV